MNALRGTGTVLDGVVVRSSHDNRAEEEYGTRSDGNNIEAVAHLSQPFWSSP